MNRSRGGMVRWEFPNPSNLEEFRARQPIVESMERWWRAFAAQAERIDAHFARKDSPDFDVVGFVNEHLKPINEGICWEFGPALRKPGHRLVITPEGKHELRLLVRDLLRRAPELPRWEFYSGRLPETPEVASAVAEQIARFKPLDLAVRASLGRHRRIDLEFHIGNSTKDQAAAKHYIFRFTEQLLGEEVLDNWLGVIELAPPRGLVSSLLGKRPSHLITPDRLKETVDALINASQSQLPDNPPRRRAQRVRNSPNDQSVSFTSFALKPDPDRGDYADREDLFVLLTCEEELLQATLSIPSFYSGRFTRDGETFCYLKLDRRGGGLVDAEPIDSAAARGAIEDAVNGALADHDLGCTMGGGTGLRYAYIDLALTDVRRAIPILRELLPRYRVHERSWLLFFDAGYESEWIGIYDSTPTPPTNH